ncbi:MAG: pyridoxamine kinase [Clostridia bacterium]|nr:pyridoxamine kinase [Clostridia bacterium]
METMKKVAAINDLSGFGRCSITVALPVLSAHGVQCCPVPTAILSNHTGFGTYFFDDYSDKMTPYIENWKKLGLEFDCIYTGFLGSEKQIDIVENFIKQSEDSTILVDPVMGDGGKIYSTYTPVMCEKMKRLVSLAEVVTPNTTEAAILAGVEYKENFTDEEIWCIAEKIHELGAKNVVITGVHRNGRIANFVSGPERFVAESEEIYVHYMGTGDLFASMLCGYLMNDLTLEEAVKKSAAFVYKTTKYSLEIGEKKENGVAFEKFLKEIE